MVVTMITFRRWLTPLLVVLVLPPLHAQAQAQTSLATVKALKCSFTLMTIGTWDKDVPAAEVTPAKLSMQFDAIDTQDGTANVVDVSAAAAGAPHITVRLLADNLHFMSMNVSGSVYLTTVFADKESRSSGRFKAVHTRHEFTAVRLSGWTSRPEQVLRLLSIEHFDEQVAERLGDFRKPVRHPRGDPHNVALTDLVGLSTVDL